MREGLLVVVAFIITLFLIFFGVLHLGRWMDSEVDKDCKVQFGQEWVGNSQGYNPDMCINRAGEVKYPL